MTTISAKIIADSISKENHRLTTMELRYPRCIHSEFMTHRQFSRNAASSRAIPVAKMIESIKADPFVPLFWGSNKPGMQAGEECDSLVFVTDDMMQRTTLRRLAGNKSREVAWLAAMDQAIAFATEFSEAGYHKQIVNRLLEPFMHITVVVSSTEWSNFLALRDHTDAEPHIAVLARRMRAELRNSIPKLLHPGEWHLPYIQQGEMADAPLDHMWVWLARLSAARCARTSYLTHDGARPLAADDIGLYQRLAGSKPLHASPLEHQATPDQMSRSGWDNRHQHGNFVGWRQFRKMHEGECQ